ncbi:hypothetical protein Salat_1590500 [Sesamum alatum]|uniref:Uncharacterized protein n=1 Tax=Sesamum alatum TaxID=300844 RepID=A0AAE1YDF0_9LAMI|nr:hypothetical protein Salat_1590500 [Sesamum alatum]
MALMMTFRPAWLSMAGVPDYGLVHNVKDKGKGKLTTEGGDGQGSDWVDWDMNKCGLDSEDDEFDIDDSVDYSDDNEYFDDNIDKDVEWVGLLEKDQEDVNRFDSDDQKFPQDDDPIPSQPQPDPVPSQPPAAPIQQDEVIVNEDCPPLTQPEDAIHKEADLDNKKKPVRRAIFNDEVEPVVVQVPVSLIMHFHNVNPKPLTVPTPAPPAMHPSLNIRASPPILGHPPGFVSKPITDPVVPHSSGPIIMKDGKRYVMLSNLNITMQSEQYRDKGKRREK